MERHSTHTLSIVYDRYGARNVLRTDGLPILGPVMGGCQSSFSTTCESSGRASGESDRGNKVEAMAYLALSTLQMVRVIEAAMRYVLGTQWPHQNSRQPICYRSIHCSVLMLSFSNGDLVV